MPFKFHFLFFYLIFTLSLVPIGSFAQYSPYFENYSLSEYNAGNRNWDVSEAENGKLYVANNNGLLEYDGLKWSFYELPNKTIIRSVLAYKDRIYTGSFEEFGFWKTDSKGDFIYTSISNTIKSQISPNEDFWKIVPFKDAIIFRSFETIYIYKDGKPITIIKPPKPITSCDVVDNKLFVSTLTNGIFNLENDTLIPIINENTLINTRVVSISESNGALFITTQLNGCFVYKNNVLSPWNSEISTLIKQHQLNKFARLENGNMVFGTIKNGVYVTSNLGDVIFHINKENGLINNTVLGQLVDSNQKLWLGLDNGIAKIDLNSHLTFYNDISGKLGAVYDVIQHRGTIYIGSNTGLFYLDNQGQLQFIDGSQGQVWDLKEINGQLFCGHNSGTYLIENNTLIQISSQTGGWVIKKVPEQSNIYIQGTYAGLVRFKKENGTWNANHLGSTTLDPIRFLVFEDNYNAWVAHAYRGLYKIEFSPNYSSIVSVKSYENKGLLSNYNVRVYNIKNNICFKTNYGWEKYEPLMDSIVPFKLLNQDLGEDAYIISDESFDQLVIKDKNNVISFKSFNDKDTHLALTSNFFKNRLIVGFERVSKINDTIYALNLNDGFMLIDEKNYSESYELHKPTIERVEIEKKPINLINSDLIEFPYKQGISISLSSAKSDNHFFEYAIQNADSINWRRIDKEKLELPNLNSGNYTLLFRTSNNFGITSEITHQKIHILPPWYKNRYGFALYTFLLLAMLSIFYVLHKRKIIKEQKLLQIKLRKEQREMLREKTLENERKIVELKNEALKNEVKLKSKQLANTAMALVKKNETLTELKNELLQHKEGFNNYYSYKKLLKKVDGSIAHKDEWKIFEHNFNQVHEEFFNQLKNQHSNLTHKDLKICAYIKMNLASKEIAPLLNISIRGVETSRYRLKRKLNLENDNSLVSFLQNFK